MTIRVSNYKQSL